MSPRSRAAAVASVALHGAALLLMWRVEPSPHPRPPAIRVELVIRTPPSPPPPQILAELPAPQTRAPRRGSPARKAPPAVAAAPTPPPAPETEPLKPPEPAPAPPPPVKVDLFAPDALSKSVMRIPAPPPPPRPGELARLPGEAAGERAANEAERVAARVSGVTMDSDARQKVQAGLADPSYARMGRAFVDAWDPDRALPETSAELWLKRRARNAAVSTRLWQEAGANYGRTGSAMAPGETLEKTTDLRPEAALGLGTDGRRQSATYRQYMQGKFNAGRSAHVLVDESPDDVRVSLVQPSGDSALDLAAVEDVRAALLRMRADDPQARRHRKSLWMMRLLILINPPVPVVGVSFDALVEKPRIELPLDRHLYKHVELEAVYEDGAR